MLKSASTYKAFLGLSLAFFFGLTLGLTLNLVGSQTTENRSQAAVAGQLRNYYCTLSRNELNAQFLKQCNGVIGNQGFYGWEVVSDSHVYNGVQDGATQNGNNVNRESTVKVGSSITLNKPEAQLPNPQTWTKNTNCSAVQHDGDGNENGDVFVQYVVDANNYCVIYHNDHQGKTQKLNRCKLDNLNGGALTYWDNDQANTHPDYQPLNRLKEMYDTKCTPPPTASMVTSCAATQTGAANLGYLMKVNNFDFKGSTFKKNEWWACINKTGDGANVYNNYFGGNAMWENSNTACYRIGVPNEYLNGSELWYYLGKKPSGSSVGSTDLLYYKDKNANNTVKTKSFADLATWSGANGASNTLYRLKINLWSQYAFNDQINSTYLAPINSGGIKINPTACVPNAPTGNLNTVCTPNQQYGNLSYDMKGTNITPSDSNFNVAQFQLCMNPSSNPKHGFVYTNYFGGNANWKGPIQSNGLPSWACYKIGNDANYLDYVDGNGKGVLTYKFNTTNKIWGKTTNEMASWTDDHTGTGTNPVTGLPKVAGLNDATYATKMVVKTDDGQVNDQIVSPNNIKVRKDYCVTPTTPPQACTYTEEVHTLAEGKYLANIINNNGDFTNYTHNLNLERVDVSKPIKMVADWGWTGKIAGNKPQKGKVVLPGRNIDADEFWQRNETSSVSFSTVKPNNTLRALLSLTCTDVGEKTANVNQTPFVDGRKETFNGVARNLQDVYPDEPGEQKGDYFFCPQSANAGWPVAVTNPKTRADYQYSRTTLTAADYYNPATKLVKLQVKRQFLGSGARTDSSIQATDNARLAGSHYTRVTVSFCQLP